jgi:LytS/YehU family sensor histidine kinase
LEVDDTGVGMPTGAATDGGFGLTQVRERLNTMYGTAASLELLCDRPEGVSVHIRLPAGALGAVEPGPSAMGAPANAVSR